MNNFFHKFQNVAQFEKVYNSGEYSEPWVSYIEETDGINYNNLYRNMPLTFEVLSDGNIIWGNNDGVSIEIFYRKNGGDWTSIDSQDDDSAKIEVKAGDKVEFRGNNQQYSDGDGDGSFFQTENTMINVYGNIMSLIDENNFSSITSFTDSNVGAFENLFCVCNIISAENLVLPATTLANWCYQNMFNGCTSLTTAPALPATTLAQECYAMMFAYCTSLTTAPELPATTLASNCYYGMFQGCTSLTTAPELPATTLANYCYQSMFNGCSGLTTAPLLPATYLMPNCYASMFDGCKSLTTAPALPATTLASYCYQYMFHGCTSLTTAPVLPAATLAPYCYYQMFQGCSNLNIIKCLATDISATDCTTMWVQGLSGGGYFEKSPNMLSWTTGNNGIPNGWAVGDAQMNPPGKIFIDNFDDDFMNGSIDNDNIYSDIKEGMASDKDDWLRKYMKGSLLSHSQYVIPEQYDYYDETIVFSGETYYVYENDNGGMYALLSPDKANYYTLHTNSMEYNNMNYESNYKPFDYMLTGDYETPGEIYDCRYDNGEFILVKVRP